MVSEFRKYRTELKKALKWPPPPQRKKREEKLVMSWSLCESLTADVTQPYTRSHFSLAGNHCSAARNQPPKPAAHRALKHRPANTPRSHPGCTREKKIPFSPSRPPKQTPNPGGGKGAEEECNNCPAAAPLCRDSGSAARSSPLLSNSAASKSRASPY